MNTRSRSGKIGSASRTNRTKKPARVLTRRLGFESLEHRRLLSTVGLSAISNVTLPAGTSVLVPLNGSDSGQTITFGATTSSPNVVTPIMMPQTNKSVQFTVDGSGVSGTMTFQLFDNLTPTTASHIETLVNDGFYKGDYIYRAETGSFALIQGGNNPPQLNSGANVNSLPSGVPSSINEEFNPDLNYTTAGDLAMARTSSPNTSGTEFFISDGATRTLDYSYTLFGFQTLGTSVVQALDALPTTDNGGINYLNTPVKITQASIITDTQDGVLMLRAPTGATGSYTVTVTASDGTNTPTTQTFTVNVVADTATSNVANPWAADTPTAPTSVAFQPQSGQGTTTITSANNSSASTKLQFLVKGVTSGDQVTIYANGIAIGSAVAAGSSTTVTTDGSTKLINGTYTITATQTALSVSAVDSGDSSQSEKANVDSLSSAGVQLQVNPSLALTSVPGASAAVGQTYTYTVATNAPSGDTVTVTPGTMPTGMTFDAATQTFTWTPTAAEEGTAAFTYSVADAAGNTTPLETASVDVAAAPTPTAPSVTTSPTNQTVNAGSTVTFTAAASGSPTPTVQWEVSTDGGTAFSAISGATSTTYSFTATAADNGNQYEAVFTNSSGSTTSAKATLDTTATGTISGYAYLDTQDAGKWSAAETGFAGLTVQLQSVGSQGSLADVSGVGPVQTAADGAYSFPAVPAGTYQIQIEPAPYVMVGQLSPGSEGGTAGTNEIQVTFDGQNATDYNFAILGAKPNYLSLQMFISATDSLATYLPTLDIAPAVAAGGSSSATNTTTYSTGAAAVFVAPQATIAQTDSPTLASMTATIQDPVAGEELSVDSTDLGTALTAAPYANGVLKITGVASVATYQALLQTLQYSAPVSSAGIGNRMISIVVNDGTASSTVATSTVAVAQGTQTAPAVTTSPTSQTVNAGSTATFTAAASGSPTPTVQWEVSSDGGKTFTTISGATSTTYSLTASSADNGNEYEAVFTNSVSTATSTAATLTVDYVTTQPASQTVNSGQNVTFTVASSNPSNADKVQWQLSSNDGQTFTAISGATSTSYSFTAASSENGNQYEAVFTNSLGTLTSSPATLTVDFAPTVTTNPANQTVNAGGTVTFTAVVSGSPTPTVQWQVSSNDGQTFTPISGATSTSYSFTASSANNGNEYEAVFTNSVGSCDQHCRHLDGGFRHHPARQPDGRRRPERLLHRGQFQRQRRYGPVGDEHGQRIHCLVQRRRL